MNENPVTNSAQRVIGYVIDAIIKQIKAAERNSDYTLGPVRMKPQGTRVGADLPVR